MRKCRLAAPLTSQSWSPRFKPSNGRAAPGTKTGQRNTSVMTYFPTWKGGKRMERLRHYFHADMAALLETDRHVLRWTTEVQAFQFDDDGRDIHFTPNFQVTELSGTRFIRLVRETDFKAARRNERHELLKQQFGDMGMQFDVLSDVQLAAHPHLQTARDILFHRYRDVPDEMVHRLGALAAAGPPPTLGELHVEVGGDELGWEQLLSLVAQGHVDVDLAYGLTPDTPVVACMLKGHL